MDYWHGGAPGRAVGDRLISREQAAAAPLSYVVTLPRIHDGGVTRKDRVYFANDREFARAYAYQLEMTAIGGQIVSRGTLYRVEPQGPIEIDEDYAGKGISWCSASAIVTAVEEVDVRMRERDAVRSIGQHCTWDDGRPMYHPDGRLNLTWQMKQLGFTQEELDQVIRPWTRWESALARLERAHLANR